jgi:hypothetical protein
MPSKSLKDPKDIQNETTEPTEFLILDFSEAKGIYVYVFMNMDEHFFVYIYLYIYICISVFM